MDRMLELFDGYSTGFLSGFGREELDDILGSQGLTVVVDDGSRRRVFLDREHCPNIRALLMKQRQEPRPVSMDDFAQILREADYGYGLYGERIGRTPHRAGG